MIGRHLQKTTAVRRSALTSRSVPASVAPLRLQFFSLAFFSVATLRLIPVIWLPSMSTPLRLAPAARDTPRVSAAKASPKFKKKKQNEEGEKNKGNFYSSPSRLALTPAGSSKLQHLSDAPSALVHSIFTPCRLAACDGQCWRVIY